MFTLCTGEEADRGLAGRLTYRVKGTWRRRRRMWCDVEETSLIIRRMAICNIWNVLYLRVKGSKEAVVDSKHYRMQNCIPLTVQNHPA